MAAQNPGQEFVVLKAVSGVSATRPDPKFRWAVFKTSHELDDGIPF
ncbi:hypothetical protein GGQ99_001337 [Aminobacter niigataensis]|uniref:Uncharacterized protein n=1 Tax=Aminobacter niigataensis TaxID=83265 RepID=A0ABR6KYU6_9HYPH|nr:hypothetical protein [Aminobacter niigataensis]MBB4649615.1 hypothetical protein [Aminobacter niigataensis]